MSYRENDYKTLYEDEQLETARLRGAIGEYQAQLAAVKKKPPQKPNGYAIAAGGFGTAAALCGTAAALFGAKVTFIIGAELIFAAFVLIVLMAAYLDSR